MGGWVVRRGGWVVRRGGYACTYIALYILLNLLKQVQVYMYTQGIGNVPYTIRVALTGSFLCPCTCVHTTLSQSAVELRSDVQDV